ncbi:MAG TPA: ATPase, T2SS/T4P/T4SS family, partial [Promicromonospora sp.]|nr:ATPase, T2SS/T4P/T4SS family [Promicromonospora sp.]
MSAPASLLGSGPASLLDDVRSRLATGRTPPGVAVRDAVRESGRVLGSDALRDLERAAAAELTGAGPLQGLLELPGVTDVLVNGPRDVWVDQGSRLRRVDLDLGTPAAVRSLAVRLAALGGQRLDDACPTVDARLPDGTRLHAVLEPLAEAGAVISLRVLRTRVLGLDELVAGGALPAAWSGLLRSLVRRRANVLISGGTGTG